jgi:hypothetical protein
MRITLTDVNKLYLVVARVVLFVWIGCLSSAVWAQDLALNENPPQEEKTGKRSEQSQPLKKVLAELETQYKVNFNYDSDILHNLYVEKNRITRLRTSIGYSKNC